MQRALTLYRSNPTNGNFRRVHTVAWPWVRRTANNAVSRYATLGAVDADDVANEGLLALSNAARRFVHYCPRCGDAFILKSGLERHAMEAHRLRGISPLVGIEKFSCMNSKLAMKRTANRLICIDEILVDEIDKSVAAGAEPFADGDVLLDVIIRQAAAKLSDAAAELLKDVLMSSFPEQISASPAFEELSACLAPMLIPDMRSMRGAN